MWDFPTSGWMLWAWQLARLAIPAARYIWLDVKVLWWSPTESAFRIIDPNTRGIIVPAKDDGSPDYRNDDSLQRFAELVWVWNPATTEWENIPLETMLRLAELGLQVFPSPYFIARIQDRVLEKRLAKSLWGEPQIVSYALSATVSDVVVNILTTKAKELWCSFVLMPSLPWHDIASVGKTWVPIAMIFVRHDGVSHNPAEHIDAVHLRRPLKLLEEVVRNYAYVVRNCSE